MTEMFHPHLHPPPSRGRKFELNLSHKGKARVTF